MDMEWKLKKLTELAYKYGKYDMGMDKFHNCPDYKQYQEHLQKLLKELDEKDTGDTYVYYNNINYTI